MSRTERLTKERHEKEGESGEQIKRERSREKGRTRKRGRERK